MRLALLGAFPFPAPQGSQRFAAEQARALRDAGHDVTLFCYGSGDGRDAPDLRVRRIPRALSPSRLRAGPDLWKPLADASLALHLLRAHRARRFDAVLAHNAEALAVAVLARAVSSLPVVYVAHTLWRFELASYLPEAAASLARRLGAVIDAAACRRADGVLSLSRQAEAALAPHARGPLLRVPPGHRPEPAPEPEAVRAACHRHQLPPGAFVVYAGNLDRYQDLPALDRAAAQLAPLPCVAVTHDLRGQALAHLRVLQAASPLEARALVHGARVAVLPRRRAGGFPIKLLHYMEAALPIVAVREVADSLVHDRSAWLLPHDYAPDALAEAIRRCFEERPLAARLGHEARDTLAREHDWPRLAEQTLALLRRAIRRSAGATGGGDTSRIRPPGGEPPTRGPVSR